MANHRGSARPGSYRLHKTSGNAVATINGRDIYLGPYGSPESRIAYFKACEVFYSSIGDLKPKGEITVEELVARHLRWSAKYYIRDGKPNQQHHRVRTAIEVLLEVARGSSACDFGPLALKQVRDRMVRRGWCRNYVNALVGCIKRCWKWGVSEELVDRSVYDSLMTVEDLRKGKSAAIEHERVGDVADWVVDATMEFVLPVVRDMIAVQRLTGMRSGELTALRPCHIDRSGVLVFDSVRLDLPDVWIYKPPEHKTDHLGHHRIVLFGPQVQVVLTPYLDRDPDRPCFSPREAMEAYRLARGQSARPPRKRTWREHYDADSYRQAVVSGADQADRAAKQILAAEGKDVPGRVVPRWHPHQLRHNVSTQLTSQFGPEIARVILGHRDLKMTLYYAQRDFLAAAEVMRKVG